MMDMDGFMQIMEQQSKLQVDSMYTEFASLCADKQNNQQTAWLPSPICMSLTNVLEAINQWNHDANDIAKKLCGIIPLYFRRDILQCYANMRISRQEAGISQLSTSISSIIAHMQNPIIVSCWNDLNQIATKDKNIVSNNSVWAINNKKIESLDIPMLPAQFCKSFLIIEKGDAPFLDFKNLNTIFIPKDFMPINDIKNSCYLGYRFLNTNNIEYAILFNNCNLFYNPDAIIYQIVIKQTN